MAKKKNFVFAKIGKKYKKKYFQTFFDGDTRTFATKIRVIFTKFLRLH